MNDIDGPSGEIILFQSEDGKTRIQVKVIDRTVWLSQKLIAELYQISVKTINEHLINIYEDDELLSEGTIRKFRIVQLEGSRKVERLIDHYNLEAILAVGYRVRSNRGTLFRKWSTKQLQELLIKGFVLDDERLKEGRFSGQDYFDELLERIRDIRSSERRFYQKITDIYATSVDYDSKLKITQDFYATVQNKLHWAIHGNTAAEIVRDRVNSNKPNMGLMRWKNAPDGKIRKSDVIIAKNYLNKEEIESLNLMVSAYLEFAELQARKKTPMYMSDWIRKLDSFLNLTEHSILTDTGKVSRELANEYAGFEYEKFLAEQKKLEFISSDFDKFVESTRKLEKK